jgi:hypothetical protein
LPGAGDAKASRLGDLGATKEAQGCAQFDTTAV